MDSDQPEPFGNVPNASETFGNVPQGSESFGTIPKTKDKTENHTLTVREAARMFELAGAARTERSIINWCNLNRQGVSRLDCYYEPNERKYFITPQSVERAIAEELAKARNEEGTVGISEPFGNTPPVEREEDDSSVQSPQMASDESQKQHPHVEELEKENVDLKITNRAKDYFIQQLKDDRENFARERSDLIAQLTEGARRIGELETKLLQIEGPKQEISNADRNESNPSIHIHRADEHERPYPEHPMPPDPIQTP